MPRKFTADLEDYGPGPMCERVTGWAEKTPDGYMLESLENKAGEIIKFESLSERDQRVILREIDCLAGEDLDFAVEYEL